MADAATRAGAHPVVEQIDALTTLRFGAALYVLAFHYFEELSDGSFTPGFVRLGYTGVTFFFILSGFILTHNYHRVDFGDRANRARYVAARLARIYPVFLLSLLVSVPFALAHLFDMPPGALKALAASSGLLAPLGLHAWLPGASCAINCPSWSVSAEFFFYLLFPALVLPIMRAPGRWLVLTLAAWAGACVAYIALWDSVAPGGSIIANQTQAPPALAAQAIKYFPVGHLPEFMLGIVLYAVWQRQRGRIDAGWALAAFAAAALAIVAFADRLPEILLHTGLTAVAWVPLILAAASLRQGVLCSRLAVFLGRISFSLYLFHVPVLNVVKALDKRMAGFDLADTPLQAIALVTALAIVVAAVVFLIVEEPSRRRMSRWLAGWRPCRQGDVTATA